MKKITLTLLLALTIQFGWTQCNELYISEIFYGEVDESDNFKNFSIEIFNPKGVSVNLSDYSFKFTAVGKTDHFINLTGTLADKGKFVVTLATSETALANLSDFISGSFDFYNYEMLYFEKNGVVIDRFGKDNITTSNYDNFDIATFLTDPNYLATIDINLQSLEDIDFRRSPLKTEGDLTWNGLIDNWYPYTTANFNNIGEHLGICNGEAVLGWADTDDVEQDEDDGSNITADVDVTGNLPSMTSISHTTMNGPFASQLNQLDDLNFQHTSITSFGMPNGGTATVDLGTIVDDNITEFTESCYMLLQSTSVYEVDATNKQFIFSILDNDDGTAINDINLKEKILIYPIVFNNNITIDVKESIQILSINIVNDLGQNIDFKNDNNSLLSFNSLPSAYYFLVINTNKGMISQKIMKK